MTPYEIEIMLHFFCSNAEFARSDAPAYKGTIEKLRNVGLLSLLSGQPKITARGIAYVKLLCLMPYPAEQWVIAAHPGLAVTLDAADRTRLL